jgi:hypothetical protein
MGDRRAHSTLRAPIRNRSLRDAQAPCAQLGVAHRASRLIMERLLHAPARAAAIALL